MNIHEHARAYRLDATFARVPIDLRVTKSHDNVYRLQAAARPGDCVELVLPCGVDERFAGFGEQFVQVDKRGRIIDGWVGSSNNKPVAHAHGLDGGYKVYGVWYSSAGYAAILHTTRRWRAELAVRSPVEVCVRIPGGEIDCTIVVGRPEAAIPLVTQIIGRAPLAAAWTYGVWKAIRGDHDEIVAEARRTRDEGLPATAIWVDSHFQPDTHTGFPASGTYSAKYPTDMRRLTDALHAMDYRVLSYVNNFMYVNTPRGDEAMTKGYCVRKPDGTPYKQVLIHPFEGDALGLVATAGLHATDGSAILDYTNADAVAWWKGLLAKALTEEHVDGWMQDFADSTPPDAHYADGTTDPQTHNRYPVLYFKAAYEAICQHKPDAVFFGRPGYTGAQQYAPAMWPGDQTRDWSVECGIGSIPASGISIGLMGVAAWGPDIAGLMGFPGMGGGYGEGCFDEELWIRFCQLGAMTPIMREHLGFHVGRPVDSWYSERTQRVWRQMATWHTALFPYLYGLARANHETGLPVLRGMMIHYPQFAEAWTVARQWMLGDALLCAPVLDKGAETVDVWLPPGEWVHGWTMQIHQGPGWVTIPAPLEQWPVLQRRGSVVPMLREVPQSLYDARYQEGDFDVALWTAPGPRSAFTMHDGTHITLDGDAILVDGPRERGYVVLTADGQHVIAEGRGAKLELASA